MRYLLMVCLLGAFAAAANGQTTAPSAAERMLSEMLQPSQSHSADESPTTHPQAQSVLEPVGYASGPGAAHSIREGSDVIARRGHLRKIPDSAYSEFVFDQNDDPSLQPMLVLPNLQLMSMEDAGAATRENLTFTVSGMVTEYRGKNFILLEPGPEALNRQSAPPAFGSGDAAASGPASADQMLKDMLSADKPAPNAPPDAQAARQDRSTGSAAVAPRAPVLTVLPEQSQIFDRVCRLITSPDGMHEELSFDADGATMDDPPIIVLPNLKLVDLEKAAGDHNTRVRVTGILTEYRGRNFILLQKVVVMAESDRQF